MRLTLSGRMVASAAPSAYLNVATCVTAVWFAEGTSNITQPTRNATTGASRPRPSSATSVHTRRRGQRRPPPPEPDGRRGPSPAAGPLRAGGGPGGGPYPGARPRGDRAGGVAGGSGWCGRLGRVPRRRPTAHRGLVGEQRDRTGGLGTRTRRPGHRHGPARRRRGRRSGRTRTDPGVPGRHRRRADGRRDAPDRGGTRAGHSPHTPGGVERWGFTRRRSGVGRGLGRFRCRGCRRYPGRRRARDGSTGRCGRPPPRGRRSRRAAPRAARARPGRRAEPAACRSASPKTHDTSVSRSLRQTGHVCSVASPWKRAARSR